MPVHPICRRTLHKSFTNKQLERMSLADPRAAPVLAPFFAWIANKDPDFHAPTRRRR